QCPPSASGANAADTSPPAPAAPEDKGSPTAAAADKGFPTAAALGGVGVILVALIVLGVALYRRRQASTSGKQPQSVEMGTAETDPAPSLLGAGSDGLRPMTPFTAVPVQVGGQDQFKDLWSSPTPTEFPPPLPALMVDDGKQVEQILANIERERTASPRFP
ncbi:hypothetical protein BCR44DRAFT_50720, partial [Catenaria anguillulae PL171]